MKEEVFIGGKEVCVFYDTNKAGPVIYVNSVFNEGEKLWEECQSIGCQDFVLVDISKLNWDDDMSPWEIPPISTGDRLCNGKANEYLQLLTTEIIPAVEETIKIKL